MVSALKFRVMLNRDGEPVKLPNGKRMGDLIQLCLKFRKHGLERIEIQQEWFQLGFKSELQLFSAEKALRELKFLELQRVDGLPEVESYDDCSPLLEYDPSEPNGISLKRLESVLQWSPDDIQLILKHLRDAFPNYENAPEDFVNCVNKVIRISDQSPPNGETDPPSAKDSINMKVLQFKERSRRILEQFNDPCPDKTITTMLLKEIECIWEYLGEIDLK